MDFAHPISDSFAILLKVSQKVWQRMLPGFEPSNNERMAQYSGMMDGTPYWSCHLCRKPVVDDAGKPITKPEDVADFERFSLNEEALGEVGVTAEMIATAYEQLETFKLEVMRLIGMAMSDIAKLGTDMQAYYSTRNIYSDLRTSLRDSWQRFYGLIKVTLGNDYTWNRANSGAYDLSGIADIVSYNILYPHSAPGEEARFVFDRPRVYRECLNSFESYTVKVVEFIKEMSEKIGVKELNQKTYIYKAPVCWACFENVGFVCADPECRYRALDDDEMIEVHDTSYNQKTKKRNDIRYNFCKDHAYKCDHCSNGYEVDDDDHIMSETPNGETVCSECWSEAYDHCEGCSEVYNREDAREIDGSLLCPSCYAEEKGVEGTISKEEQIEAKNLVTTRNGFYPLDEKTIEKSVLPTLMLARNKQFKTPEQLTEFLLKRLQSKEAKASVQIQAMKLKTVEGLLSYFEQQLAELKRFKQEYPGLTGFRFLPVKIEIEKAAGSHGGSVFVLYPTEELLNYGETLMPGAKEAYDRFLAHKGHHYGAFGYARFTVSNDVIVIDNLQTDLDAQSFSDDTLKENPPLRWWLSTIKKFWAPYLLDTLRQFGTKIDKEVYLTSFEMQQKKWNSIPERSIDVYDRLPADMGMEQEEIEVKPEDLAKRTYRMFRVARSLDEAAASFMKLAELT